MENKKVIQKLYYQEGMSIEKISQLWGLKKPEIDKIINENKDFIIASNTNKFRFRKINSSEIKKYSNNVSMIKEEFLDSFLLQKYF